MPARRLHRTLFPSQDLRAGGCGQRSTRVATGVLALLCSGLPLILHSQLQALQVVPGAPDAELVRARALMHEGRYQEAEPILRQQVVAHPTSADAKYALGYCLLRLNRPADALTSYTAAAAVQKPSAEELVNVGQAYVLLGDFADADKWTLQAVRTDPRNAGGWYSLGRIRYTDQHFADAVACFKRVLELWPRNVKAEDNMGLALEGMNRMDEAIAAYREAIAWQETAPASAMSEQPLLNLSIVLLHRGELAEAQPLLKKAASIASNDPHIHEQLGHLYMQQAAYAEAQAEFQRASQLEPGNSSYHYLLGQAYQHLGKRQEAQVEFDAVARLTNKGNESQKE